MLLELGFALSGVQPPPSGVHKYNGIELAWYQLKEIDILWWEKVEKEVLPHEAIIAPPHWLIYKTDTSLL